MVFAVLVILGLLAWLAGSPNIAATLFGVHLSPFNPTDPLLSMFFTPLICGALALLAGFAFPKGFYLWGIALNLHSPFAQGLTSYLMEKQGIEWLVGGIRGLVSYVAIAVTLFFLTILCYTALSAVGLGMRHLSRRIISR